MNIVDPQVPPALVPSGSVPRIVNGEEKQYIDLPSVITPNGYLITRWEPTPDERSAVLRGEDIYVTLLVPAGQPFTINPMFVTIGPVDWTVNL